MEIELLTRSQQNKPLKSFVEDNVTTSWIILRVSAISNNQAIATAKFHKSGTCHESICIGFSTKKDFRLGDHILIPVGSYVEDPRPLIPKTYRVYGLRGNDSARFAKCSSDVFIVDPRDSVNVGKHWLNPSTGFVHKIIGTMNEGYDGHLFSQKRCLVSNGPKMIYSVYARSICEKWIPVK
jgi:hypothetical protein